MRRRPLLSWPTFAVTVLLPLAACAPARQVPSVPSVRTVASAPETSGEDLAEFFARAVASGPDIAGTLPRFIIYTELSDPTNLWFGVSRRQSDMRRCWRYDHGDLTVCSPADLGRAFRVQGQLPGLPKMFFAIATERDDEVLVVLDYYRPDHPADPVDGYRYVLTPETGVWTVKSVTAVY